MCAPLPGAAARRRRSAARIATLPRMLNGPHAPKSPTQRLIHAALGGVLALALAPAAAQAARAAPTPTGPPPPDSFLLTPTEQLGWPGFETGTEVTPTGDLYTGYGEQTFSVGAGTTFDPKTHNLDSGRYPIVRMFKVDHGVLYQLTTFQTQVAGAPVTFAHIYMKNLLPHFTRGRVVTAFRHDGGELTTRNTACCVRAYRFPRPREAAKSGLYEQPGVAFNPDSAYALQPTANGTVLLRDGKAVLFYSPPPAGSQATQILRAGGSAAVPATQFGRTFYNVPLPRGAARTLDFRLPVVPIDPADGHFGVVATARFPTFVGLTRNFWRSVLGRVMAVSVPEAKVTNAFYASIINDALARYTNQRGEWIQTVNQLRYHSFYIRDAAVITRMFDLVGLHAEAEQNLDFFLRYQQDDGLFISRPEQFDNFGQALWAIAEHYRRTDDLAFARRMFPAVRAAMNWFIAQRAIDPLHLMPAVTSPYDNDLVAGHLTGDNFWAAAGVQGAVDMAAALGESSLAANWRVNLGDFENTLRTAITARRPRGPIPASLDQPGGQQWGALWGTYPGGVFPAASIVTQNTMRAARRTFSEGILTYANHSLLHDYSGFRVFETELLNNQQLNVVNGLYSELAHTTGTHAGFEAGAAPFGDRVVDDSTVPHGWFAAEYATLLRNMLVREDGNNVVLMSAVSPLWIGPGKRISVRNAPTARGGVNFLLVGTRTGANLYWSSNLKPGTRLLWQVPYAARNVRARGLTFGGRQIALSGSTGHLTVSWTLVGKPPSAASTFQNLMAAYARSPRGATARHVAGTHGPARNPGGDLNSSAIAP